MLLQGLLIRLTFFDVLFASPGSNESAVVLNWQKGLAATHDVAACTASGVCTINGVRGNQIETDHTDNFVPVSATPVLPSSQPCKMSLDRNWNQRKGRSKSSLLIVRKN